MMHSCQYCEDRALGCHDRCPSYLAYREQQLETYKEKARHHDISSGDYDSHHKRMNTRRRVNK